MDKSTHEPYKVTMFAPALKTAEGGYIAVLTDTSIDRDDEFVHEKGIQKIADDTGYIAGLLDHNHSVLMNVCEWCNRKVIDIDGHKAIVGEPRFFMSNPNAQIIKGMLDEGAQIGISIGAIVKDYDEFSGKRGYTDLELIEASFVAIPANKHGRAWKMAKSFNPNKSCSTTNTEDNKMENQLTQKDIDSAVEKKAEELTKDFEAKIAEKVAEIDALKKELTDKTAEADKKLADAQVEVEKAKTEAETVKKAALEKAQHEEQIKVDKAQKDAENGMLPVGHL